ncbi:MAG: hypothetical protein ACKVE4_07555 [Dissulfuribacterales bacterium]
MPDGLNDLLTDQEIHDRLWPSPVENGTNLLKRISKQEAKAFLIILMEYCPENLSDFVLDN